MHEVDLATSAQLVSDVFGDAVNVAARVQSVAGAGGITISERVYDDMRNRKGMEFEFLGEKQLKNVNRPIRIYNIIDREFLGDAPPPETREGKSAGSPASAAGRDGAWSAMPPARGASGCP